MRRLLGGMLAAERRLPGGGWGDERDNARMIVDCAHYRDGRRQHEGRMDPRDAAAICRAEPGFVWLGMVEPSPSELAGVQEIFGLHELAVEDAQSFHLR